MCYTQYDCFHSRKCFFSNNQQYLILFIFNAYFINMKYILTNNIVTCFIILMCLRALCCLHNRQFIILINDHLRVSQRPAKFAALHTEGHHRSSCVALLEQFRVLRRRCRGPRVSSGYHIRNITLCYHSLTVHVF